MTSTHDFISVLHDIIEETFPNTERFIISGGDYISDFVMELREGDKKLRYSPYELYCKSTAYEDTIEEFVSQWKEILLKN